MSALQPLYHQYRSLDQVFVVKIKNDSNLAIKIFDVTRKCLHKQVIPFQALEVASIEQLFANTSILSLLENLVQKQLLPKEHFPTGQRKLIQEDCLEAIDHAIQQFKPKVITENREMEQFTCP
ncbi:MAG: hypothetical protein K1000chlam2_01457, partial [Chlamydiae bacterium]|nr:hypothetical protein [Chlamydiota bacterium]